MKRLQLLGQVLTDFGEYLACMTYSRGLGNEFIITLRKDSVELELQIREHFVTPIINNEEYCSLEFEEAIPFINGRLLVSNIHPTISKAIEPFKEAL